MEAEHNNTLVTSAIEFIQSIHLLNDVLKYNLHNPLVLILHRQPWAENLNLRHIIL